MLDIKLIREKPDWVRQRLATRGAGEELLVEGILQTDEQRRKALAEVEALKAQRNRVSKEIGALMGQKKLADPKMDSSDPKLQCCGKLSFVTKPSLSVVAFDAQRYQIQWNIRPPVCLRLNMMNLQLFDWRV